MPETYDLNKKRIWVAGHSGLVGAAICRKLTDYNCEILTVTHQDLDLCNQQNTDHWISKNKPDLIIMAAAKVGGISANASAPADFLNDNLSIAQNVIHSAFRNAVSKLVFLGSSCIYPKFATQPIKEEALLTGALEETNEGYAIAKIAGIKLCQFYRRQHGCDFISLMPCNIYGPGDHWNTDAAHVIPSLISKMHQAKTEQRSEVEIWGTGSPLREFLYVDDLTKGVLHAAEYYSDELHMNIGSGREVSIHELAVLIQKTVGYKGQLSFNTKKPNGTPRKLLDSGRMNALGWSPKIDLEKGVLYAYEDFLNTANHV